MKISDLIRELKLIEGGEGDLWIEDRNGVLIETEDLRVVFHADDLDRAVAVQIGPDE